MKSLSVPPGIIADADSVAADLAAALRPFRVMGDALTSDYCSCLTITRPDGFSFTIHAEQFSKARTALERFDRALAGDAE